MPAFNPAQAYEILAPYFQKRIRMQEPLSYHSSFGTGGIADIWLTLETQWELMKLVQTCATKHWPLLLVGSGSNILYADAGARGIVARMGLHTYTIECQSENDALLIAEAGCRWEHVLYDLVHLGWGGLEFGIGIPGTLGGGIVSNAGAHTQCLGDILHWIEVLDARGCNLMSEEEYAVPLLRRYQRLDLALGYRESRLRQKRRASVESDGRLIVAQRGLIDPEEIVVRLGMQLHRQDPHVLCSYLDRQKHIRQLSEPQDQHIGSIFIDPPTTTADALLTQAGLRGKAQGQAQISLQNANYIVNHGGACSSDIAALIIEAHHQVLLHCGVSLSLNIEFLGDWSLPVGYHVESSVPSSASIQVEPYVFHPIMSKDISYPLEQ